MALKQAFEFDLLLNTSAIFQVDNLSTIFWTLMDSLQTWPKILSLIKDQITASNFRTWFSQTQLGELGQSNITLIVSSAFIKDQLIARYEDLIKLTAKEITGYEYTISYTIDSSKFLKNQSSEQLEEEDLFQIPSAAQAPQSNLNPKYTLKNFVVGLTNNLAYAAAQAVVQNPGISYNPLFIYGPSGVGKTHLMQGIGNELLIKNPNLKLIYASSERFMNDLVESIQNKRTGDFRSKYRNCDLLLIDDIQFFAGKDSTQEEFFHTFNELQGKNAQIVLTSDRPPNDIQKLEARLASRFQGGLMVDVQLPDFDTRIAILKAKLLEKGDQLEDECISLIAESVVSNTRELEGKLIQVLQAAKSENQQPDIEFVQRFLGQSHTPRPSNMDQKKVLNEVTEYFNVKMVDLAGPRRQKELVLPRQIAMYLLYEECKIPQEKIGEILGGRDHTTVLHGVEKIRLAITRDREVQRLVVELKQHLTN